MTANLAKTSKGSKRNGICEAKIMQIFPSFTNKRGHIHQNFKELNSRPRVYLLPLTDLLISTLFPQNCSYLMTASQQTLTGRLHIKWVKAAKARNSLVNKIQSPSQIKVSHTCSLASPTASQLPTCLCHNHTPHFLSTFLPRATYRCLPQRAQLPQSSYTSCFLVLSFNMHVLFSPLV